MRAVLVVMAAAGLAACSPEVPDSGVGFGDYATYLRERERALASGQSAAVAPPGTAGAGGFSPDAIGAAIDRADGAAPGAAPAVPGAPAAGVQTGVQTGALIGGDDPNRPRGDAPATIRPETGEAERIAAISDEQDFGAVSARETIESDAQRIARARAQYQVVAPTALPTRAGPGGPNIVAFALATTHNPGTPVYRRGVFAGRDPLANCGRYASSDLAQEAFLTAGGPERDPQRLDPDGDGFVCGWDPRPFRAARQ